VNSFCGSYAKEIMSVPAIPLDIYEFKLRVTAAIEIIDKNTLERV
jgi:hypothetical protein